MDWSKTDCDKAASAAIIKRSVAHSDGQSRAASRERKPEKPNLPLFLAAHPSPDNYRFMFYNFSHVYGLSRTYGVSQRNRIYALHK